MGWEGHPVAEEQPLCCSRALGAPCTVLSLIGAKEARNCLLVASPQAEGSETGPWGLSPPPPTASAMAWALQLAQ